MTRWDAFFGFLTGVRVSVLILAIVVWNLGCGLGIYLNGGLGQIRTRASNVAFIVTVGAFAIAFFALRFSGRVQELVLKPSANTEAIDHIALGGGILLALMLVLALASGFSRAV
jgi:hypothetical protein